MIPLGLVFKLILPHLHCLFQILYIRATDLADQKDRLNCMPIKSIRIFTISEVFKWVKLKSAV